MLEANTVSRALKFAAAKCNRDPRNYSCHSLRIGGATALLQAGIEGNIIRHGASQRKEEAQHRSPKNDALLGFCGVDGRLQGLKDADTDRFALLKPSCRASWTSKATHAGESELVIGLDDRAIPSEGAMIPANVADLGLDGRMRVGQAAAGFGPAVDSEQSQL